MLPFKKTVTVLTWIALIWPLQRLKFSMHCTKGTTRKQAIHASLPISLSSDLEGPNSMHERRVYLLSCNPDIKGARCESVVGLRLFLLFIWFWLCFVVSLMCFPLNITRNYSDNSLRSVTKQPAGNNSFWSLVTMTTFALVTQR